MNIVDYIGIGRENAVTREQLCTMTGLPDRTVRKLIADARNNGEVIINAQDGAGYYITDDPIELKMQYRQNENRALNILRQQKHIRRKLASIGQTELEI